MNPNKIAPGLYEQVIDHELADLLQNLDGRQVWKESIDEGESHNVLAQHVAKLVAKTFASLPKEHRLSGQVALTNRIISLLSECGTGLVVGHNKTLPKADWLLEIVKEPGPLDNIRTDRPETPFSTATILTGTRLDPSLVSQLRREMLSADRIDILCSFIKWSGIRILEEGLRNFTAKPGNHLRVITTSYMGATEAKAVEFLRQLPNTEVKIAYDVGGTRLHAKAYQFYRSTGFSTAYVGSANISSAALTDGLEWTVKISQFETEYLWDKISATFETYWQDPDFTTYTVDGKKRLTDALLEQRTHGRGPSEFRFDITPHPFQQEILDRLDVERTLHGRFKNLIVAATGTGKTVIAGFDYKRLKREWNSAGKTDRLLFVAHRQEILEQSISCFRAILGDYNFGDLLVGNHEPVSDTHLFVSIQSFNSRRLWNARAGDYYDMVIIDESHHLSADSYQPLVEHLNPTVLLALTATPERADGNNIFTYFGGHISAEIRLPTAINKGYLCPFQYFGITDSVNLSELHWQRGGYVKEELDSIYSNNRERANLIVNKVRDLVLDPSLIRALGFCVSIRHAEFMAKVFADAGIPSAALSSNSSDQVRHEVRHQLLERQINLIFTVDLYNEGVDIPEVDTVLFLRPTESLTIFLQQLGRGLRESVGKECLTVLDFIGQAHKSYDFEGRYRALMDEPKLRVDKEIQAGCPHVPLGCSIQMERKAQEYVLENIQRNLSGRSNNLVQKIASFESDTKSKPTLANFLKYYEMDVDDLYRRGSWTELCTRAKLRDRTIDPDAAELSEGLRRIAHIDAPGQIQNFIKLLSTERTSSKAVDDQMRPATMLHMSLWRQWKPDHVLEGFSRLDRNPDHKRELLDLLKYKFDNITVLSPPLSLPYKTHLELYCSYTRDEILAALGHWDVNRRPEQREGTLWIPKISTDLFFITLNKTEKQYSPTTMYQDYAISDRLFHWQSQSTTSVSSPTGQRYINHVEGASTILLFVRDSQARNGLACPYIFLGPATYGGHSGSKPISIIWRLTYPIPAKLIPITNRLAVR